MEFMMAFGWVGIMLGIGILLRAKSKMLKNMMVPASVIAGITGMLFMNTVLKIGIDIGTNTEMYTDIVNHLFTISFISIGLTNSPRQKINSTKEIIHGALGMGLIWCFLYALTPMIGAGIIALFFDKFNMDIIYGVLIPFGFCQGPGQAASFGAIFEKYGWSNATAVAITFAAGGFLAAIFVGIPIAKYGIKKGIAKNCGKIDEAILKGYLKENEQIEYLIRDTTCNSNIETLSFHFALIGICYILAVVIARMLSFLPSFLGDTISNMMFMNGMYAAYIVKWVMKKFKLDFLHENVIQSKITGWTTDYLVVCAFMAISIHIISQWIIPIIVVIIIITGVTFIVCFYFGQRIGGNNDFERALGLYGTCTGTVPSGISLIRIVDPQFKTATIVELGMMNLVMIFSTPTYIILLALASGTINMSISMGVLATCCLLYLMLLKVTHTWKTK